VKQLTEAATHRADLQLAFAVYKQTHEYVQLDTEKIKNELAQSNGIHKEEIAIYTKKLNQLHR